MNFRQSACSVRIYYVYIVNKKGWFDRVAKKMAIVVVRVLRKSTSEKYMEF